MMRDKRRKTPALPRGTPAPEKPGRPFGAGQTGTTLQEKRRCGARFPAFCCCGWAWEERYLPLSQALTCRLGAER